MTDFTTPLATLKEVTLEEFLSEIDAVKFGQVVYQYNTVANYGDPELDSALMKAGDAVYKRNAVILNELTRANVIEHILYQVGFYSVKEEEDLKTWEAQVNRTVLESIENFGLPTHLVYITSDVYGVFCASDFTLKTLSPLKNAIICRNDNTNLLIKKK